MTDQPISGADPITDAPTPDTASAATDPTGAAPAEKTPEQMQAEIEQMQAEIDQLRAAQQSPGAPAAPMATTEAPPAPTPPADVPPQPSAAGTVPTTGAVQPVADPTPTPAPVDYGTVPDGVEQGSIVQYNYTPPGADTATTSYGLVLDRVDVDDATGGPAADGQPSHVELVVAPLDAAGYRVTGADLVEQAG